MTGYRILVAILLPLLAHGWTPEVTRRNFMKSGYGSAAFFISTLIPEEAVAYERRDVGDDSRSAITAAMNEQAYQTNSRLEASGFKLDTREEEHARLSDALASFSYDGSTKKVQAGYRSKTKPNESKLK